MNCRVAELGICITHIQLKIVQVCTPTTSHSDEGTSCNLYNDIDKILDGGGGLQCKSWRTNKYTSKRRQEVWHGQAELKRRHSGRMGNINEMHDHGHTI